jgi:anti-sigma factor RsiW
VTCRDFAEFLTDYLDKELSPAARARFEEHLSACPDCVAYLSGYQRVTELARIACSDEDSIPPDVPEELVQAVLSARNVSNHSNTSH